MHPFVVAAIATGGVFFLLGGYHVVSKLYEEYEERREYEAFVRQYADHEKLDDDDEEDEEAVRTTGWHKRNQDLRHRKHMLRSEESLMQSSIELDALEKSIQERQQRLEREQQELEQAERQMQQRREALAQSTSSILQPTTANSSFHMSSGFSPCSSSSSSCASSVVADDEEQQQHVSRTTTITNTPHRSSSDGYRSSGSDGFASVSDPHTSDSYDILSDDDYRSP